jgi:urease accessory protein
MTARLLPKTCLTALTLAAIAAATPALAHHPMGGMTPTTFMQGLLSGFGHPVIGLDHLAALVGVGLVASRFPRGLVLPVFWIVAMAAGVGLHLASFDLPFTEVLVALSVVAIGIVAALRPTLPFSLAGLLFAVGGLIHGYALGESIIGAEASPLFAYLLGLVLVQAALTVGVAFVAQRFSADMLLAPPARLRIAGLAVALAGGLFLMQALPGAA